MFLTLVRDLKKLPLKTVLILGTLVLYFLGYQPVFHFPPLKRAVILAQEPQQTIHSQAIAQPFILPHPGYISTRFSFWHPGVDLATNLGMPVHPVLDGQVIDVEYTFWGLGHFVTIQHDGGYKSTYGHMGKVFVKSGDLVKQSTILGEVGLTGATSGPHTHLELTKDGSYIDPLKFLPTLPDWPDPNSYSRSNIIKPSGGPQTISPSEQTIQIDLKKELKFNL